MVGAISANKCYIWSPSNGNQLHSGLIYQMGKTNMWHRKLGHLNLISMRNIFVENSIINIPDLRIEERKIC